MIQTNKIKKPENSFSSFLAFSRTVIPASSPVYRGIFRHFLLNCFHFLLCHQIQQALITVYHIVNNLSVTDCLKVLSGTVNL